MRAAGALELVRRPTPARAARFAGTLHPVLRRVYVARGIVDAAELDPALHRLLPIGSLESVAAAAELLARHREGSVLVIGDYDADGATSSALFVRALRSFGFARVEFLVPNRFEFGYGLSPEIVALAARSQPSLIVTVDNGIASNAGVEAARAAGIAVLITDHHLPGATLPRADVIVNPNLPGSAFASRALAGVGVAFYVISALRRRLEARGELAAGALQSSELLDLVALGTVADVVPFDANNRILVAQGLLRIRAGRCVPGIRALLEVARRERADAIAADLGYAVAPRLNAAGRLTDMSIGIRCLLCDEPGEALELAHELDALNRERRAIEARMQEQARSAVRSLQQPDGALARAGVCLFDPGWHQGVVGLVAGRIKERLRRPVVAFAPAGGDKLRGSARSIAGVHIRDVLDAIAARDDTLMERFGGHAMAAGLTLPRSALDRFARAFDAECERALRQCGSPDRVETDGELSDEELSLPTAQALRAGGPWGPGFPEPLFEGVFRIEAARVVGGAHLKLRLAAPEGRGRLDAIAFGFPEAEAAARAPPASARLVYRLGSNEYLGERRLQLVVEHLLPA